MQVHVNQCLDNTQNQTIDTTHNEIVISDHGPSKINNTKDDNSTGKRDRSERPKDPSTKLGKRKKTETQTSKQDHTTEDSIIVINEQDEITKETVQTIVEQNITIDNHNILEIKKETQNTEKLDLQEKPVSLWNRLLNTYSSIAPSYKKETKLMDAMNTEYAEEWNESARDYRACPFYKYLPGTKWTVDAFKFGKVENVDAYLLR
jgi:hypothetical protein